MGPVGGTVSDGAVVSIETGARVVGLVRHESQVGLRFLPPFLVGWLGVGATGPGRGVFWWFGAEGVASCRCATRPRGGRATRFTTVWFLPGCVGCFWNGWREEWAWGLSGRWFGGGGMGRRSGW